jgi:ElaB/YqjD/DUF883 family membrane-anchored ribosome-binding protein
MPKGKKSQHEEEWEQHMADAEVVVSEVLQCNRNGALKRAVGAVIDTTNQGVDDIKRLYRQEPYIGLLLAGAIGLTVGLLITKRWSD